MINALVPSLYAVGVLSARTQATVFISSAVQPSGVDTTASCAFEVVIKHHVLLHVEIPEGSDAVVAVIEIEVVPVEYGSVAHVKGFGVGAVVSGGVSVVADSEVDQPVAF